MVLKFSQSTVKNVLNINIGFPRCKTVAGKSYEVYDYSQLKFVIFSIRRILFFYTGDEFYIWRSVINWIDVFGSGVTNHNYNNDNCLLIPIIAII